MDDERNGPGLNTAQRRHLLTSSQYADKLLAEIEAILTASQSKSPFPKFKPDLTAAQAKIVQDYIARMRAQLVRILDSQGVPIPEPMLGALHSIRVTLRFVDIAFDECRPKRMSGYGEVAPDAMTALSGLVDEMQGIISRLDTYLAQGPSADLAARLQRLESAGADLALVKTLERMIDRHGLVEFRPPLATIIERLETHSFEIAVFGRVSSGKSSLLNHIVGREVLPVGVNPITAVPTRLAYGLETRATAWFADHKPEQFTLARLAEFVTEEQNPGNVRHVTRIVVELPAPRLREGVVFVDTPGLGGLATSGAAETKAYLPRCDLGVVLIDAGSTLTPDDLATIQALSDSGIPSSVLLSKADLLAPADRERACQYVADHIRSDLGMDSVVHAISIRPGCTEMLDAWLESEILPLYERHTELARQSLNRKIGAVRLGVEAALRSHLKKSRGTASGDAARLKDIELELRLAAGRIAEARTASVEATDALRNSVGELIQSAVEAALGGRRGISAALENAAAERSAAIASSLQSASQTAVSALARAAEALGMENGPDGQELGGVLKDMPRLDLGSLGVEVQEARLAALLGSRFARWSAERQVRERAGPQIQEAVRIYARVLQAWARRTFEELQARFDSYADGYRAQISRLTGGGDTAVDEQAVRSDLAALSAAMPKDAVERSG
jgi:GTP-binding protein EngB required for normal cell division